MTAQQEELRDMLRERDRWRVSGNEALAEWYDQCARLLEHQTAPAPVAAGTRLQQTLFVTEGT